MIFALSDLPPLAKTVEVAQYLRCSEPQVREYVRQKRLHAITVGRGLRIPREAVARFIAGENIA